MGVEYPEAKVFHAPSTEFVVAKCVYWSSLKSGLYGHILALLKIVRNGPKLKMSIFLRSLSSLDHITTLKLYRQHHSNSVLRYEMTCESVGDHEICVPGIKAEKFVLHVMFIHWNFVTSQMLPLFNIGV